MVRVRCWVQLGGEDTPPQRWKLGLDKALVGEVSGGGVSGLLHRG